MKRLFVDCIRTAFGLLTGSAGGMGVWVVPVLWALGLAPVSRAAVPNTSCSAAWCLQKGVTMHASNIGLASNDPVWFSYTPQTTGSVTFSTCEGYAPLGLGIKPALTLFSACGGAQVASGTNSPVCSGYQQLSATLNAGTTYFLRATPPPSSFGFFSITTTGGIGVCASAWPINDTCANAFPIRIGDIALGTTVSATPEGFSQSICDANAAAPGVWYTFTGTGARVSLDTCPQYTDHDTVLSVFTGSCTGAGLTCLTSNDDLCDVASRVIFDTAVGQTYFILVSGYLGSTGNFQLRCASGPPANDQCSGAILLPQTFPPTTLTGTTINAEVDTVGIPVCEGFQRSTPSVWYRLIGAGQPVTIDTCNTATDFPTRLTVFSGGCPSSGGVLACVSPASRGTCPSDQGIGFGGTSLTFLAQQGVEYLVLVDSSAAGGTGNFKITATQGVVNDTCDGALLLVPGATLLGDSTFATADSVPYCLDPRYQINYESAKGLWYTFFGTGGSVQLIGVHAGSPQLKAYVDVFSGTCSSPLCRVPAGGFPDSVRTVATEVGKQYWALVRLSTSNGLQGGPFSLALSRDDQIFDHVTLNLAGGTTTGGFVSLGYNEPISGEVTSQSGRFVVFTSNARDLTPQPLQNLAVNAVFVRDRLLRTTRCVSVAPDGSVPNGTSYYPSISGNGRFIYFQTDATNINSAGAGLYAFDQSDQTLRRLASGGRVIRSTDDGSLVLLQDNPALRGLAGGTIPFMINSSGQVVGVNCAPQDMSPDGRFILFRTILSLVPTDTNTTSDIYLRDRAAGTTELVSVRDNGATCTGDTSQFAQVSSDGRLVAFFSNDNFIVPGDNDNELDLFVRDRVLGTTRCVTTLPDGTIAVGRPQVSESIALIEDGPETSVIFKYDSVTAFGFTHPHGNAAYYAKNLMTGAVRAFGVFVGNQSQFARVSSGQLHRNIIPSRSGGFITFQSDSSGLAWSASGATYATEEIFLLQNSRGWLNTTPGSTGNITDANNWPLGVPPGDTGAASFASPNVFSVNFPQDFTTASLIVSAGDVTYNLNGYTYFVTREAEVGTAFDIDTILRPRNGTIFCGSGRIGGKGLLDLSGNAKWKFVDNTAASAGEVRVKSPARVETSTTLGTLSLRTGSKLTGDGVIDASVISTGEILPGLPTTPAAGPGAGGTQIGTLTINRNFEQVNANQTPGQFGGTLRISLDGNSGPGVPGGHDRLAVGQTAYLGGGLIVTKNPAFDPVPGTTFSPLTAGTGIVGTFDVAFFPGLSGNRYFRLSYPQAGADAALAGGSAQVTVELLGGQPSFGPAEGYSVTGTPRDALLGDFNDDGFLDLALAVPDASNPSGLNGSVVVLLNAGNGPGGEWLGFSAQTTKTVGRNPAGLTVGRFRGAAFPLDIAVVCESDNQFRHLKNSGGAAGGTRTFTDGAVVSTNGSRPVSFVAMNLNGDSIPDLAIANQGTIGTDQGSVTLFITTENAGNASFSAAPTSPISVGSNPVDIAAFDANSDGLSDFVTADSGSSTVSISIRLPAAGTFMPASLINVNGQPVQVEPGGLDNPKDLENLSVICNGPPSGGTGGSIDILINRADGSGAFHPPVSLPLSTAPRSITSANLDADGDTDLAIVVAGTSPGTTALRVIRNDSTPGSGAVFADQGETPSDQPLLVLNGDVDNDGRRDLVTVNNTAPPPPAPMEGHGDGELAPRSATQSITVLPNTFTPVTPPCPADINGDGAINTADLTLLLVRFGQSVTPGSPAAAADINGDGAVNTSDLTLLLVRFGSSCV